MSNIFNYLFSKKGNTTTAEEPIQANIADFIKEHTVEMPGRSRMVMIPVDEFEEMVRQAEATEPQETVTETIEMTVEEQKPEVHPELETTQPVPSPEDTMPDTELPEAIVPTTAAPEQPASDVCADVSSQLEELKSGQDELKALLERENYKDSIIKDLHKEMERLNGNFFEDIRRPMIKSIIAIHRQMTGRVKALEKNPSDASTDYEKLYNEMAKNLKFDMTAVADTLEDEYDLEFFEPAAGDFYNPKEDNAIRVIATDDAQQDGVIAEVLYGGFKNTSTERIFLKANVIVYKHK